MKFKEYSRSIQALKNEFSRSIHLASLLCFIALYRFRKSVPDFEICAQSLNYFDTILHYFPSEQKFKEYSLFSSTFSKNSSFQGPLKSKIKFQGFSRTSRSSTNLVKRTHFKYRLASRLYGTTLIE